MISAASLPPGRTLVLGHAGRGGRHAAGGVAPAPALAPRGGDAPAIPVLGRHLVRRRARRGLHRHLRVARRRGGPPALGRPRRHRTRAGPRTAPHAARRPRGRGGARARHAARHHHARGARDAGPRRQGGPDDRRRPDRRRHPPARPGGPALPRHPGQADLARHRGGRPARGDGAEPPRRGGRGAAAPLRRGRDGDADRLRCGARLRPQPCDPLRARQPRRECRRFRPSGCEDRRPLDDGDRERDGARRRAGLRRRDPVAARRALCDDARRGRARQIRGQLRPRPRPLHREGRCWSARAPGSSPPTPRRRRRARSSR